MLLAHRSSPRSLRTHARTVGIVAAGLVAAGACRGARDAAAEERATERQEVRRLAEQAARLAAGDSSGGTRARRSPADTGTHLSLSAGSGTGIARGGDPPLGPGDVRVTSTDGMLVLAVIGDTVRSRLGDAAVAKIKHDMAAETDTISGVGGVIARSVTGVVSGAMSHATQFSLRVPVRDVRDMTYANGELRFRTGKENSTGAKFTAGDAERFMAAVRARQARPAGR